MRGAGEDEEDHPLFLYFSGASRYQLDAPSKVCGEDRCARDYLKDAPVIWTMRRLGRKPYRMIMMLERRDEREERDQEACRFGIESVSGPRAPTLNPKPAGLRESDLDKIHEYDFTLMERLGPAIIAMSKPLSAAEGKR